MVAIANHTVPAVSMISCAGVSFNVIRVRPIPSLGRPITTRHQPLLGIHGGVWLYLSYTQGQAKALGPGFYQGFPRATPTALSQFILQLWKVEGGLAKFQQAKPEKKETHLS